MISSAQDSPEAIQWLIRNRIAAALAAFRQCRSSEELHTLPQYRELRSDIDTVLLTPQMGDFRMREAPAKDAYRFVAWNIERGTQLNGQLDALRNDPKLRDADT